jgi:hypothetical protein
VCVETEVGGEGVGREVGVFVENDVRRLDVDAVENADERGVDKCDFGCSLGSWAASGGIGGGERERRVIGPCSQERVLVFWELSILRSVLRDRRESEIGGSDLGTTCDCSYQECDA